MGTVEHVYEWTGGWESFEVPDGISQVTFRVEGAGSGARKGGVTTGNLPVNPGETLWLLVGGHGHSNDGSKGGAGGAPGGARGGDGRNGKAGGAGGGGGSMIRRGFKGGSIIAVAGGAGGDSGDNGHGGAGGGSAGGDGEPGTAGTGTTFPAKGGTPKNSGNGGASGGGKAYAGNDAVEDLLGAGGAGGEGPNGHGGGGGGGGVRGGGGGAASAVQNNPGGAPTKKFPGGGGGGGGGYVHSFVSGGNTIDGGGNTGNGRIVLRHSDTPTPNFLPSPPSDVKVNGLDAQDELATKALQTVNITARLEDANVGDNIRMWLVPDDHTAGSPWRDVIVLGQSQEYHQIVDDVGQETGAIEAVMILVGLAPNTLYEGQLWAMDEKGALSGYKDNQGNVTLQSTKLSFWTDRPPNAPDLLHPSENTQIDAGIPITFEWGYDDPDGGNVQGGYALRYRVARTPLAPAGAWVTLSGQTGAQTVEVAAAQFSAGVVYEWTVASTDPEGLTGDFAVPKSFYILGATIPPILVAPISGVGVDATSPATFTWVFRDSGSGVSQVLANLRYRAFGTDDWITLSGDTTTPGAVGSWTLPAGTFIESYQYEWQAQTRNSAAQTSDWSEPATFWAITRPGGATRPLVGDFTAKASLGSGHHRAMVYLRGGQTFRGELTNITSVKWDRRRDDVGEATVVIEGFDDSLLSLLATIDAWSHELVLFREANGVLERVWEGPITSMKDEYDRWTIEAGDCGRYIARRDLRQGYNDANQVIGGIVTSGGIIGGYQVGLRTVVERAERTIINALAYDDPNMLPYLTALKNPGDAKQSRVVPDYSKTVWEDIDDMAANNGLDYTIAGRRIILWDTHRPIGRLPELRNSAFSAPPTITGYGMQLANHYAVTDGSGVYGVAERGLDANGRPLGGYGFVEMLATAYGVDVAAKIPDASSLTSAQRSELEATFAEQADRNIAHRWPTPFQVRLPDNTRIMPDVQIGINQLIPGVWIPIRAKSRVREIAQWQKLDRVTVTEVAEVEQVTVIMQPAPNGGDDPDSSSVEGSD